MTYKKNHVVKKPVYNKLVAKVDNIDNGDFVLKTKYNTNKTELENKIPDTSGFVRKTNYITKITELENKIPDISNLATKSALTPVENKIPSVSNLVKKTNYNTSIKLLWYQNKNKIYWKLFKTIKYFIYSWKSSKYLHCI